LKHGSLVASKRKSFSEHSLSGLSIKGSFIYLEKERIFEIPFSSIWDSQGEDGC
jgi:hypothetical protein